MPEFGLEPHSDVTCVIPRLGVAKRALGEEETRSVGGNTRIDEEREAENFKSLPNYKLMTALPKSKTAYRKRKTASRGANKYILTP